MSAATSAETTYCEKHPDRETGLRCNRCNRLMCTKCAVHTPIGYRCDDCVKKQSKVFDTAEVQDYLMAAGVGIVFGYIGSIIVSRIGFFTLLLAPAAGTIIADIVRTTVKKRRSKLLFQVMTAAIVIGCLPMLARSLLILFAGNPFSLVWQALYTVMATSSAYYRISGISFKR